MNKVFQSLLLSFTFLPLCFGQDINTITTGNGQVFAITTSSELYAWGNNTINSSPGVLGTAIHFKFSHYS